MVICLLLAVDTQKAIRLFSDHKELDQDWEDTLQATEIDDKEFSETMGIAVVQTEKKVPDAAAAQTVTDVNTQKKAKKAHKRREVKKLNLADETPVWKRSARLENDEINEYGKFVQEKSSTEQGQKKEVKKEAKKEEKVVEKKDEKKAE
jgi:hypothetical protein